MNTFTLLRLEWLKFRSNNLFRAAIISYFILLPGMMAILLSFDSFPPPLPQPRSFFNTPEIYKSLGYAGNWIAFFVMGFVGLYIVSLEYSHKTLRQSVINGLSRQQVFLAKLYFVFAISLVCTLYYIVCALLLGYFGDNSYQEGFFGVDWIILRYFIMVLGYMSFGFFLGILLRSMGIASLLYFMYIFFLELIIRYVVHIKVIPGRSMLFYPMNAFEDLTPSPLADYSQMAQSMNIDFELFLNPLEAIITSLVYIFILLSISYYLILKRDL